LSQYRLQYGLLVLAAVASSLTVRDVLACE
jgi:hypothetical protein